MESENPLQGLHMEAEGPKRGLIRRIFDWIARRFGYSPTPPFSDVIVGWPIECENGRGGMIGFVIRSESGVRISANLRQLCLSKKVTICQQDNKLEIHATIEDLKVDPPPPFPALRFPSLASIAKGPESSTQDRTTTSDAPSAKGEGIEK